MEKILKALKYRFYQQGITKRIIVVITALSIISNLAFVGSVFIIMRHQLINKTMASSEQDVEMVAKELDMFFEGIRNDSLSVIVSEACQTLLSDFNELLKEDVKVQYQKYKLIQTTIMSTVGQRGIYNTIIFYDIHGNSYPSDGLISSKEYELAHDKQVSHFLNSEKNEDVLTIHKSPWRKKKDAEFADCISYLRKVYNKETGQMIGAVEFEVPNRALYELYRPVMENENQIYIVYENQVLSSLNSNDLYRSLESESWYEKLNRVGQKGNYQSMMHKGKIYIMRSYSEHSWKIVNEVSSSAYMKDILFYAALDLFIGMILLVANLKISSILIVSITKPISKITEAIVDIGSGNYDRRVQVKDGGEIGTLAEEFNRMVDKTEMLMGQIVEKEQGKRETELALIQMQMTPHFFYNILESICGLIVIDEKKMAIHTIGLLSGFYRGVLNKGKEIISIKEEINIAFNYLEIMKICHPGKFTYNIECEEAALENCVNKLTLQPILENAIHHGFRQMESRGEIHITCWVEREKTILEISDNGCGLKTDFLENEKDRVKYHMDSFGLRNTQERICLHFGEGYGIRIMEQQVGTKIRVEFPVKLV